MLVVPGGMVPDFLLKITFHRHRPGFAVIALQAWHWRVGVVFGAFAMILLVGFSHVYFGAHYLSDVLSAAAAGLAWLVLSLTAVDTLRRSRSRLNQTD